MLHVIRTLEDELIGLISDDPVRPEIPAEQRVNHSAEILVLKNDQGDPVAVTCVKFLAKIPESVEDLMSTSFEANTAVFYTIWSYAAGAGRKLILEARDYLQQQHPGVDTYVTLSPKTEMARRFHLNNGAELYRENPETVNYRYQ